MSKRNRWDTGQDDNVKRMVRAMKRVLGPDPDDYKSAFQDISNHGADAGVSGFIYFHETGKFYSQHSEGIWQMLHDEAEAMGAENTIALVSSFKIANQIEDAATFENALVWFALEVVASRETEE